MLVERVFGETMESGYPASLGSHGHDSSKILQRIPSLPFAQVIDKENVANDAIPLSTKKVTVASVIDKDEVYETVCRWVQEGLVKIKKNAEEWQALYGDLKGGSDYFTIDSIPKIEDLQGLLRKFADNKKRWAGSIHISDQTASIDAYFDKESPEKSHAFLHLNLTIGHGGKKEIHVGVNLLSFEAPVAIYKIASTDPDFDDMCLSREMFDKLSRIAANGDDSFALKAMFNGTAENIRTQVVVQTWCLRGNLQDFLYTHAGKALSDLERKELALDFVSKLKRLRDAKIVFADLKPDNLLVERLNGKLRIKFTDLESFGFESIDEKKVMTSRPYLAPETIMESVYTPQSEIWAAGIILYCIFAGSIPSVVTNIMNKPDDMITSLQFMSWSPAYDENASDFTRGAKIVSDMMDIDSDSRPSLEKVLEELNGTPAAELVFPHQNINEDGDIIS